MGWFEDFMNQFDPRENTQYAGVNQANFDLPGYNDFQNRYTNYLTYSDQRQAPMIGSLESLDGGGGGGYYSGGSAPPVMGAPSGPNTAPWSPPPPTGVSPYSPPSYNEVAGPWGQPAPAPPSTEGHWERGADGTMQWVGGGAPIQPKAINGPDGRQVWYPGTETAGSAPSIVAAGAGGFAGGGLGSTSGALSTGGAPGTPAAIDYTAFTGGVAGGTRAPSVPTNVTQNYQTQTPMVRPPPTGTSYQVTPPPIRSLGGGSVPVEPGMTPAIPTGTGGRTDGGGYSTGGGSGVPTFRDAQRGSMGALFGLGANPMQSGFRGDQGMVGNAMFGLSHNPQISDFRGDQRQLAGLLMRRAQGLDSVAEGQLRQGLDMSNAQQRSMMASARPNQSGMAMRLGMQNQATNSMGLTGQAAQARAQEAQMAAMGLGGVLQGARGQDIEDYNRQLQGLGMAANVYGQARGQDIQDYQRQQEAYLGAGGLATQARNADEARLMGQAQLQMQQQALNDQQRAELLRQSLLAGNMQQQGGMGYEQQRTARYGADLGVPTDAERIAGGIEGAYPYLLGKP